MKNSKILLWILWITLLFSVSFAYTTEEIDAYNYAFENGITTMSPIEKANMWWNLTRIAMAKMLSNYAINILWLTPDTSKNCYFSDISSSLDYQYDNWVTNACQLGLMWVWIAQFNPYWLVTRAEFWTVLSRALNSDNPTLLSSMNNASPYYSEHLNFLNEKWIMNNISMPLNLERRWRVMLMLMRADDIINSQTPSVPQVSDKPVYVVEIDSDNRVYSVGKSWVLYKNEAHGIQIDFGNIRNKAYIMTSNGLIDISFRDASIAKIRIYNYDEYDTMLEQAKDNETCDTQCFLNTIIWHNNTYYFGLGLANMSHDELKLLINGLQCVLVDTINGTSYDCSWYEWINWKYVKTWKSWAEQLFPDWSFEFFDPVLRD